MPPDADGDDRSVWDRLAAIPDLDAATPPDPAAQAPDPAPGDPAAATPTPDARRILVPPLTAPDPATAAPQGPRPATPAAAASAYSEIDQAVPPTAPPPAPAPTPPMVDDPGTPDDAPPAQPRRRRPRRRWLLLLLVPVVLGGLALVYAAVLWGRIDRIDTEGALSPGGDGYTNYLIVGTDSRANVDPDDPAAPDLGLGVDGTRADSMIILHVGPNGNRMVSLPRDLLLDIPGNGRNKLNAARAWGGPALLIETVQGQLNLPIHRYFEVDLAGFMDVVDAVGGVTIDFPEAACDVKSGLFIDRTGPVELGREAALAYVRSRGYTEFDAAAAAAAGLTTCAQVQQAGLGSASGDDLDRTARQRDVLLTTLDTAAGSWNPIQLLDVLSGLSGGLKIDDQMGFGDALRLARTARNLDAANHALPVDRSGFDLVLNQEATAVLDLFRPT